MKAENVKESRKGSSGRLRMLAESAQEKLKSALRRIGDQLKAKRARSGSAADAEKQPVGADEGKIEKTRSEFESVHLIALDRICTSGSPWEEDKKGADDLSDPSLAALAQSINELGQLSPLIVRRISSDDSAIGGIFSLVCGERRYRALKILGRRDARCIILDLAPDKLCAAAIADNIHRRSADIFDFPAAARAYMNKYSLGEEETAAILSVSLRELRSALALLDFSEPERDYIRASALSASRAALFLPIHDADERLAAMRYAQSANLDASGTRDYVERCCSSVVVAGQAPERRRKLVLRDLRIFYNSVDRALALMNDAGIAATALRGEDETAYTLTVRIPKRSTDKRSYCSIRNNEARGEETVQRSC